ncbi:Golgin-84 [Vitis vinifera]|uniref:Golgin-84 n=1 Tax=Vitis vinifera TaxID=29760 RepID=A0A438DS47_VITVI|nr:Golgin-84 [Vitis vinifera]
MIWLLLLIPYLEAAQEPLHIFLLNAVITIHQSARVVSTKADICTKEVTQRALMILDSAIGESRIKLTMACFLMGISELGYRWEETLMSARIVFKLEDERVVFGLRTQEPLPLHHRHMAAASIQLQKAAKLLDSGAVRATRFLWRYPTARLLLLFYLVFVHLFLMYLLHHLQEQADELASREVAQSMGLATPTLP